MGEGAKGLARRGSRILQRDRVLGEINYKDMAPHGVYDSGPMDIYVRVKGGPLKVGQSGGRDIGVTNRLFEVLCPHTEGCMR